MKDFQYFKNILIDECYFVKLSDGMYKRFFEQVERRIVGFIVILYWLYFCMNGSMFKFFICICLCVFFQVLYYCQVSELFVKGFFFWLKYYDVMRIDLIKVRRNFFGVDFDDVSLFDEFWCVDLYGYFIFIVK